MAENDEKNINEHGLQNKSETSQRREMNRNPEGKGGFGDNPGNINKEGRPPRGWSWKDVLEEIAEEMAPVEIDGKSLTFRQAVGNRLWLEAVNGNIAAIKELFTRMDGLPRIEIDHSGRVDTGSNKVAQLLQIIYAELHEDDSDNQGDSPDILPKQ